MDNHVLDACALLTFLNDEDGVEIMEEIFEKAEDGRISLYMSIINLLEVYSKVWFNTPELCSGSNKITLAKIWY